MDVQRTLRRRLSLLRRRFARLVIIVGMCTWTIAIGTIANAATIPVIGPTSAAIVRNLPGVNQTWAYDYAPTVLKIGSVYRAWWCGVGPAGRNDYIWYSETKDFDGAWSQPKSVFSASPSPSAFDGQHTCDPDVIYYDGTYYMYYGGLSEAAQFTQIGIATSQDGLHWTRSNFGAPIVGPKDPQNGVTYGAGQPSVVEIDGWFYMIYTTVWVPQPGGIARGGEFAIRARDPLFSTGLQEARPGGWLAVPNRASGKQVVVTRDRPLFDTLHVMDMAFLNDDAVFMVRSADTTFFLDGLFNQVWGKIEVPGNGLIDQRAVVRDSSGKIYKGDPLHYNVQTLGSIWNGVGDPTKPRYWDIGRQTYQLTPV
jgi:hypothetical protein